MFRQAFVIAALFLCACSSDSTVTVPTDNQNRTIDGRSGRRSASHLGTSDLRCMKVRRISRRAQSTYLGVEVIPPFTPAGPNQQFQFRARSAPAMPSCNSGVSSKDQWLVW